MVVRVALAKTLRGLRMKIQKRAIQPNSTTSPSVDELYKLSGMISWCAQWVGAELGPI